MKKIYTLFVLIFTAQLAYSQLKPKSEGWFFYDAAHVLYLNAPAGMQQEWFSNAHTFNFLAEWTLTNNFALAGGLSYSSQNFHNNMRIQSVKATGEEVYNLIDDGEFENIEQTLKYIYIPLEIRLRGNRNSKGKYLRFYAGLRTGLRVGSYAEYETDMVREKYYNLEDAARFRTDAYLRIGYSNISLFAAYGLTNLYESGTIIDISTNGTVSSTELSQLRPLSLGLSFGL